MNKAPFIGAHFSITGGIENAVHTAARYHCNALQLFTKSSRTWKEKILSNQEINNFDAARKKYKITQIVSHASYLINIASSDKEKLEKSASALTAELLRSTTLKIPYVVLHPGSYLDQGEAKGIEKASRTIKEIMLNNTAITSRLLIETTAGQGTNLGSSFDQIAKILEKTDHKNRLGVCIDTSHIFAAGYDISNEKDYHKVMNQFDDIIGMSHLYVIHMNDSKTELGSKKDRHEHIGQGHIGEKAFSLIMNDPALNDKIKIIETPKMDKNIEMDPVNLKKLLSMIRED